MIAARARATTNGPKIRRAAQAKTFESLGHASAALRMTIRRMIRRKKKPGPVGGPIATQTGRAKGAIAYHVTKPDGPAIVGPMASRIGPAMRYHEHGGRRGRRFIPRRPTVGPAFAQIGPRLPRAWTGRLV